MCPPENQEGKEDVVTYARLPDNAVTVDELMYFIADSADTEARDTFNELFQEYVGVPFRASVGPRL